MDPPLHLIHGCKLVESNFRMFRLFVEFLASLNPTLSPMKTSRAQLKSGPRFESGVRSRVLVKFICGVVYNFMIRRLN